MTELRAHVDVFVVSLRSDIKQVQVEMTKLMLISLATSSGILAVAIAAAYLTQIL